MKLFLFAVAILASMPLAQAKTICAQGALISPEATQKLNQALLSEGVAGGSVFLTISNPPGFGDFETICASFAPGKYRMQVYCGAGVDLQDAAYRLNQQVANWHIFASAQQSAPSRQELAYACAGIWQ